MAKFDSTQPLKDMTFEETRAKKLGAEWNDLNPTNFTSKVHEERFRLSIKQEINFSLSMGEIR